MLRWWRDLSVSKKLYGVVGVMATLIALELLTLLFAMNTLSAIRSFVGGEGLWSKAQKNAVQNLERYARTKDAKYYSLFIDSLQVNLGDRKARIELQKPDFDPKIVQAGFEQGRIHPDDVPGVITVIRRFHNNRYIGGALKVWGEADETLQDLMDLAEAFHKKVEAGDGSERVIADFLDKLQVIDQDLTVMEDQFSYILGEGSRWMENVLMIALILAVLLVESSGLTLTVMFARGLNRNLQELNDVANEVGLGNLEVKAPVRSHDELGQLSVALNKMTDDLKKNLGRRQAAESANKLKTIFLANMSHEIRTPIGVILGLVELLKDPATNEQDGEQYLETIERTGNSLIRLINDILDVSKIEAGHFEMDKSTFSLNVLVHDLEVLFRPKAEAKNIQLSFQRNSDVLDYIETDKTRLQQIVVNLINNAIKFTDRGSIKVEYWIEGQQLFFRVKDSGVGIRAAERKKLFKLFSQMDSTQRQISRGAGLGLALSQRLAQSMGGDLILVESEEGVGSTFLAYISITPGQQHKDGPTRIVSEISNQDLARLQGKRVLVIDDNQDIHLILRVYLSQIGVVADYAENGRLGVEFALKDSYDVVLMDIQMPVLDGYEATALLRKSSYKKPIIALTANAMKEDRDKCLESGCNDYITKPFRKSEIYRILLKYV